MATYYNDSTDAWVRINGCEFAIFGDADAVTDAELLAMQRGAPPAPWREITMANIDTVQEVNHG